MRLYYLPILILLLSSFVSSLDIDPTDDITKIATQQVKDLDEILILIDPNAALSETQKELIVDLFTEKIGMTRAIKSSHNENKEELIEELMKDIMQKLHFDILSKNQREAKFEYQKNYQPK